MEWGGEGEDAAMKRGRKHDENHKQGVNYFTLFSVNSGNRRWPVIVCNDSIMGRGWVVTGVSLVRFWGVGRGVFGGQKWVIFGTLLYIIYSKAEMRDLGF